MTNVEQSRQRGFDDASRFLLSKHGKMEWYYNPPDEDEECHGCNGGPRASRNCARCEYDNGWDDGVCK